MQNITTAAALQASVRAWRAQGQTVALVPTMGNLHAGHLALVQRAQQQATRVVVSIFVNPLQFAAGEDFQRYPRTPEEDQALLATCGVDALFLPTVSELYPRGLSEHTLVLVPALADILCGAFRPGHFQGVATVVAKLFNMVQPDVALFGEKDYQQLLIVKRMVEDLLMPLHIIAVPTLREVDGLAMSSRNRYLSATERQQAPALYAALQQAAQRILHGDTDFVAIEQAGHQALHTAGLVPDYFSIRHAQDLAPAAASHAQLVVLTAARLGQTRLIDNIQVSRA